MTGAIDYPIHAVRLTSALCAAFPIIIWALYRQLSQRRKVSRVGGVEDLADIPGPPAPSFIKGSLEDLYSIDGFDYQRNLAEQYGAAVRIKGLFGTNRLFVSDPAALYNIFNKEQAIFEETSAIISINQLAYGEGLLSVMGEQHRKQRKMLNPAFSVANLRKTVPTLYRVSKKLRDSISLKVTNGPQEIEIVSWVTRTALELIGQSGLGYSFDTLTEDNVPHRYSIAAKQYIPSLFKLRYCVGFLLPFFIKIGSPKFRRFVVDILPWKNLHDIRDVFDIMDETSREILAAKKKRILQEKERGEDADTDSEENDIMSILLRANVSASPSESLTDGELVGQISVLVFAAMDTSSTAITRILHLLALHPEVQVKLRNEIIEALKAHDGQDLTYEDLMTLPYLDAICKETLRLHPPVPNVERVARKDTVLPLATPIKVPNGGEIQQIFIPECTTVHAGLKASNCNPEIWGPDAYEWKPERWLNSLPQAVLNAKHSGIYSNIMTFIGGNRACIGFKFAELEIKLLLSILLPSFRFAVSKAEVKWQMTAITTPSVDGNSSPTLPLVVERYKE